MNKSNNNQEYPFSRMSRREFLKNSGIFAFTVAVGGAALNLVGCEKPKPEHDTEGLQEPIRGETEEVNSPWYEVEGGSFTITDKDGANVRWNPTYGHESEAKQTKEGLKLSEVGYYGTLQQGQEFKDVDSVIKAGAYAEDFYDEQGQYTGTKEMEYVGVRAADFMKNLSEDSNLRWFLEEKVGLTDDDVVFIASGKTDIQIGDVIDDLPAYHRDKA